MEDQKYIILPVEGDFGYYAVVNLESNFSVLIAQPKKIFWTCTVLLDAFKKAQRESPEAVLKQYERYKTIGVINPSGNIRSKANLISALEQFSQMPPMTTNSLKGAGIYRLSDRILTLNRTTDQYWLVDRIVLEQFKASLKEPQNNSNCFLDDIILR